MYLHSDSDVVADQATCKVTCQNGGSCLEDETTCQCTPDFTGDKCETPRSKCAVCGYLSDLVII